MFYPIISYLPTLSEVLSVSGRQCLRVFESFQTWWGNAVQFGRNAVQFQPLAWEELRCWVQPLRWCQYDPRAVTLCGNYSNMFEGF